MRKILILGIAAIILQSCASMMNGKTQSVAFNSTPQGAKVSVDGVTIGTTPITTEVRRKSKKINFSMDGYQDYPLTIKKSSSGWLWGDAVFIVLSPFGWLIADLIDEGNGSGREIKKVVDNGQKHKIENSTISVDLKKK